MMLHAYLVDDEVKALQLLQNYIERIPWIHLVGQARDPFFALDQIAEKSIDVIFLDINMPNLTGIEFYAKLTHRPKVIFTTAYSEYAIKGFDLEAVDYLLKPIPFHRFSKACRRLLKDPDYNVNAGNEAVVDLIFIKSGTTIHKLQASEVIYLERDENYVVYHTANKKILSRQTLSSLEGSLPDYFVRIHKSYIVSLLHLETIKSDHLRIANKSLPIGKTYRASLYRQLF